MDSPCTPLHDPSRESAACGLGFVAGTSGRSAEIVQQALTMLGNLDHRGAAGSDPETGDGSGILLQLPHRFLRRECRALGFTLPRAGRYAAGMVFFSPDDGVREACERELERIAAEEGQPVLGWRDVPVRPARIGATARANMPRIRQVFLVRATPDPASFERRLYVIRRRLHHLVEERFGGPAACYVVSLSARTIVYKGLLRARQLAPFYPDLTDPDVASALALVHSRFSTNTLGSWPLAHPYRYMAHNGEINTLRGNVNWMRAREGDLNSELFNGGMERIRPVVEPRVSDSASLDNTLELLHLSGRPLPHAVAMLAPEAWENDTAMDPERRAFYAYHACLMEPWDGPAAIAFTDGRLVGATLDRNGLRPARYSVTRDGLVVLSSEEGALPLPPEDVIVRWRLEPGRMIAVDTGAGRVLYDRDIKSALARRRPYRRWTRDGFRALPEIPAPAIAAPEESGSLRRRQRAFGYTIEEMGTLLRPMAAGGKEGDGSMGVDTPPAVLSDRPQLLYSYIKQLFAQVTNPPIDPLRENLVMSLRTTLGPGRNVLEETPEHCRRIVLDGPVLTTDDLERLRGADHAPFITVALSTLWDASSGERGMAARLEQLCDEARSAVARGVTVLLLSDRGLAAERAAIPSLLAVSAVHHALIREGTRTRVSLVVETGDAREVHHVACLIGYGAAAVCPTTAIDTVREMAAGGDLPGLSPDAAERRYIDALHRGLLKVISRMGISTIVSYCGAQIFEAVGLDRELVDRYMTGTPSRLGGIGVEGLAAQVLERHRAAFAEEPLDVGGEYRLRPGGERHAWDATTIPPLQRAVRADSREEFARFTAHADAEAARSTLRGYLDLLPDPIPLEEVEPAREIVKRFSTGAMSFGSLSQEAHETLAIAMNRMGAKSNSGEGGEDLSRSRPDPDGSRRRSAIKQIASGRFGVTVSYLADADVIQIKMAQGAKPGEGGQLPGHKVTGDIARVRHSTPGVGLISPPPHHDIYSIEDLAQLIFDLKCVNPTAQVSVKLVSEVGVGTVAAGVVKAGAAHITVSGYDGGTGASPLSSIRHAGLPWELGIAEAQGVLVANGLRGRVRLQVDGGLKTGRDVVIAALLGADDVAFSTAPLIALGCIMMRACHLNTCPVGIATQDPELRRRFAGTPEHVLNYFFLLAEEVRAIMASLGFRTWEEMTGRVDRLAARPGPHGLDLTPLLAAPPAGAAIRHTEEGPARPRSDLEQTLAAAAAPLLGTGVPLALSLPIRNTDRAAGTALAGEIARRFGERGLPDDTLTLTLHGTAGQSFGAWAAPGMTLLLHGEANDYAGKGLSGGRIAVVPPDGAAYDPERSIAIGNVALYGATAGEMYVRGGAGERFAVRNSGAVAVVEGVGDHGCEYMTGGTVVVLGRTGRNFAAGMSGGTAYVLDLWNRFADGCNTEMVGLEEVVAPDDLALLHRLIENHHRWTASPLAARILAHWHDYLPRFVKVMPHDLRLVIEERDDEPLQVAAV